MKKSSGDARRHLVKLFSIQISAGLVAKVPRHEVSCLRREQCRPRNLEQRVLLAAELKEPQQSAPQDATVQ